MTRRFLASSVGVLLFCAAFAAGESEGLGPLNLASMGPSEVFREVPGFQFPMDRTPGRTEVLVDLDWLNYWIWNVESERPFTPADDVATFPFQYGTFLLDMEVQMLTIRIQRQVSHRLRLDASLPCLSISGGILDGLIEEFHGALGIDQHRRDWWTQGTSAFLLVQRDGSRIALTSRQLQGTYVGNAAVGAGLSVRDEGPSLGFRIVVRAPTSTLDVFESSGIHTTLQSTLTWSGGRWLGHHGLSFTWYGDADAYDLHPYLHRWTSLHALEYRRSDRTSLVLQVIWASPFAHYPRLDEPVVEMSLGMKRKFRGWVLEAGLVENLLYYDNSPDIGLHLALHILGSSPSAP